MKDHTYERELLYWSGQESLWQELGGKTVLISGASGMIGTCLVDLFMLHNHSFERCYPGGTEQERGIHIIALSRNERAAMDCFRDYQDSPWFRYISCDVNNVIPECGPADYIIHAAGNTHPLLYSQDPIGTIMSNVQGTKNLLDYGVSHKSKRFCFLSSVEVYGENRGDVRRFGEEYLGYLDCNTLRAGYPEGKRVGEALCNAYREAYGMDFVIPRLSRIYGPTMRMSDSKAIAQFIKRAAAGEDIVLKSKGNQEYSYTFVTDAAAGILTCMILGTCGEAYNVADQQSDIVLKELAGKLAGMAGTKVVFELPEAEEQKGYSAASVAMLDGTKLGRLGWKARVHMEEGLSSAVGGCKDRIDGS